MAHNKYRIIISDDAFTMLDRHIEFISRVSVSAAKRTMDTILSDIQSLAEIPSRCPYYENQFVPTGMYRKLLSSKRYQIIFEITTDTVYVDYILDTRQNNDRIKDGI